MKKVFSRLVAISMLALSLTLTARAQGPIVAGPAGQGLTVDDNIPGFAGFRAAQECESWCWAAAIQVLARSQGVDRPQVFWAERAFGPNPPCVPAPFEAIRRAITGVYELDNGGTVILNGAYHYGLPTNVAGMIQSIRDRRPFIIGRRVYINGQGFNHFQVVYGLSWYITPGGLIQIIQLRMFDPLVAFKGRPVDVPEYTTFTVGVDPFEDIFGTFELLVTYPDPADAITNPAAVGAAAAAAQNLQTWMQGLQCQGGVAPPNPVAGAVVR